jgi:hypothetical protein
MLWCCASGESENAHQLVHYSRKTQIQMRKGLDSRKTLAKSALSGAHSEVTGDSEVHLYPGFHNSSLFFELCCEWSQLCGALRCFAVLCGALREEGGKEYLHININNQFKSRLLSLR